ncbi:MAG: hypothetical protein PHV23_00645 [Candidatus Gracilibacteria bacterium]|nr:hypothetical protein [Candidatus Gracilibacteria bacterium]
MIQNENIWMNQEQIGELFGKSRNTITEHINNIYSDGELKDSLTMQKISKVSNSDNSFVKPSNYYNLDFKTPLEF